MSFDAYQEWFGIPPEEQPPTLYRLLGVEDFEQDPDKLHQGALQRIATLRKYQAGKHSDLSQQLMNEVSQARIILLDAQRRAEYDARLAIEKQGEIEEEEESAARSVKGPAFAAVFGLVILAGVGTAFWFVNRSPVTSSTEPVARTEGEPVEKKVSQVVETSPTQPSPTPEPQVQPKSPPQPPSKSQPKSPTQKPADVLRPSEIPIPIGVATWDLLQKGKTEQLVAFPLDQPVLSRLEDQVLLQLPPAVNQHYFLPIPQGDFRWLMLLKRNRWQPGQVLHFGAIGLKTEIDEENQLPASSLEEIFAQSPAIAIVTGTGKGVQIHSASAPANNPRANQVVEGEDFWLSLERTKNRWTLTYSDATRQWKSVAATESSDVKPVALYLYAENSAAQPMTATIAAGWLQMASRQYEEKLSSWPTVPLSVPSDVREKLFTGRTLTTGDGLDRVEYVPDHLPSVNTWSGQLTDDDSAISISSPVTVQHGPISELRRVQAQLQWTGNNSVVEFQFQGGCKITLDPANQRVQVSPSKVINWELPLQQWVELSLILDGLGNLAIQIGNKAVKVPQIAGLSGQLATNLTGNDPILLRRMNVDGRINVLPMWLRALAGEKNVLVDPNAEPLAAPEPKGPYRIIETSPEPAKPLVLEINRPVPLSFLNTPENENHPVLAPDGQTLHFSRTTGNRTQLLAGRRSQEGMHFEELVALNGLPDTGNQFSITFSPDMLSAVLCSTHEGGNARLYLMSRPSLEDRFSEPQLLTLIEEEGPTGELLHPHWAPTGVLYFTRLRDEMELYQAEPKKEGGFERATPAGIKAGFSHASLQADDQMLFLQGMGQKRPLTIFRTWRRTAGTQWITPRAVRELRAEGEQGTLAPYVTPDGTLMFFASDREGGAGGLDLWVMKLRDDQPQVAQADAAPVDNQPVNGPIEQWLSIGPFDPQTIPNGTKAAGLKDFVPQRLFRNEPTLGEQLSGKAWQLGKPTEKGVYLVMLPLQLKETAEVVLQVDSAPGGTYLWLDRRLALSVFGLLPFDASGPVSEKSSPYKLFRGKHRIIGVVCVANPQHPLQVQIVDKTGQTIPGLVSELPIEKQ